MPPVGSEIWNIAAIPDREKGSVDPREEGCGKIEAWKVLAQLRGEPVTISVMNESQASSPRQCEWKSKESFRILISLLAVIGFHIASVLPLMNAPTGPMDEGCVLVYPELFSKGIIAHRDYESPYPPGNIWFLAGAYHLYGTDINVERCAGVLYQLILLAGIFFLFRCRGLGVAMAGCMISSIITLQIGDAALAWVGALAWSVWSLVMLTQPGNPRTRSILAGIFVGLALTWRTDIAPPLILGLGGYHILTKWRIRDLLWLFLAAGVTLIPLMIHVLVVTPAVFLNNVFYKPVVGLHGARGLPLDFSNAYVGQLYALIVIGTVSTLALGWIMRRSLGLEGKALLATGLFAVGIFPEAMQRADLMHLSFIGILTVPLLVFTGSFLTRYRMMPLLVAGTVLMTIPQEVQYLADIHKANYGTTWISNGDRTIGTYWPRAQRLVDFLQANAGRNDSLLVGTKDMRFTAANDVAMYHLFPNMRPATYYIEFNPLSANAPNSKLAGDVAKADWLILDRRWDAIAEPNGSNIAGSNAPNEIVEKKFRLVFTADPFGLYRRIAD